MDRCRPLGVALNEEVLTVPLVLGTVRAPGPLTLVGRQVHTGAAAAQALHGGQGRVGGPRGGHTARTAEGSQEKERKLRAGCPAALAGFQCPSVWSLETVKRVHERLALGGAQPISLFCHIQPRWAS